MDKLSLRTTNEIAKVIDQTLLKADATNEDIQKLICQAIELSFWGICINPCHVRFARSYLHTITDRVELMPKIITVINFPLGAGTLGGIEVEAREAIALGADELDMVMNISAFKSMEYSFVEDGIRAVVSEAGGHIVKVIIETAILTTDEIVRASKIAKKAGADFIKTSTGYSKRGASVEDVKTIREAVKMDIKASGGIKTYHKFKAMIDAGATRIGTSSGHVILKDSSYE